MTTFAYQMITTMKKEIFQTAWALFKKGMFATFGQALKAAWSRVKLLAKLKSGLVYFRFQKEGGEMRDAIGTLNAANFQYVNKSDNKSTSNAAELVKYWDVEKRGFRAVRMDRFVCFL